MWLFLLVDYLHGHVADVVVFLDDVALVGVDDPHASVSARLLRFVECDICAFVVGGHLEAGDDGVVGAHCLEYAGIAE